MPSPVSPLIQHLTSEECMTTYKIHIFCTNCEYATDTPNKMWEIPKGEKIVDYLSVRVCPECGCDTLRKN